MVKVTDHLKNAKEFCEVGTREYEEGRKTGALTKMREGCEKIFHAYVEACAALIQKSGFPEPESHGKRAEILYKLGERRLIDVGKDSLVILHKYAYYDSEILPEDTENSIKGVEETIRYIRRKIAKT